MTQDEFFRKSGFHKHKPGYKGKGLYYSVGGYDITKEDAKQIYAALQLAEIDAEIRGMQNAKNRVLRRTEIPSDAKNPTRDATVYLGEAIADIIQADIESLTAQRKALTEKESLDGKS